MNSIPSGGGVPKGRRGSNTPLSGDVPKLGKHENNEKIEVLQLHIGKSSKSQIGDALTVFICTAREGERRVCERQIFDRVARSDDAGNSLHIGKSSKSQIGEKMRSQACLSPRAPCKDQKPTTMTFVNAPSTMKSRKFIAMFTPYIFRRRSAEFFTRAQPTARAARAPATHIHRNVSRKKGR